MKIKKIMRYENDFVETKLELKKNETENEQNGIKIGTVERNVISNIIYIRFIFKIRYNFFMKYFKV